MFLVIFEQSLLSIEHIFETIAYPGWALGVIVITLLGIKLDIMLKIISVKELTCQFISGLDEKCCSHGKLEIHFLIRDKLALSWTIFSLKRGGGGGRW